MQHFPSEPKCASDTTEKCLVFRRLIRKVLLFTSPCSDSVFFDFSLDLVQDRSLQQNRQGTAHTFAVNNFVYIAFVCGEKLF